MSQRPNILILVCDAARAENFSILGYQRPTTPNLERWSSSLAVYRQCISAAMWTLPSTTGLFTGTYPSLHGLVVDGDRLGGRFTTLAELLHGAGYFTAKVTGVVPYVSDFSGLDRGFMHNYEAPVDRGRQLWRSVRRRLGGPARTGGHAQVGIDQGLDIKAEADAARRSTLANRFRYWLTGFADCGAGACCNEVRRIWKEHHDQPRFVYVHMQETHADYRPVHRYRRRFLPADLRPMNLAAINQRPNPHDLGLITMSEDEYRALTALYDGCIAYLDEQIGRLLDDLSRHPDFDNTIVIITADHGDCIGRHGILGHQFVLYDELVHIPWLVKYPGRSGPTGVVDDLVQNVDLLPTLAPLAGLSAPPQCEGINILDTKRELAYCELLKPFGVASVSQGLHRRAPQYDRAVLAVRSATHKLIEYSNEAPSEVYDLVADPREESNLLKNAGPIAPDVQHEIDRLRAAAEAWRPRWSQAAQRVQQRLAGGGDQNEIDPEVEQRLRALGYLD